MSEQAERQLTLFPEDSLVSLSRNGARAAEERGAKTMKDGEK